MDLFLLHCSEPDNDSHLNSELCHFFTFLTYSSSIAGEPDNDSPLNTRAVPFFHLLTYSSSIAGEPNNDSPLNSHAASLWPSQAAYKEHLHAQYKLEQEKGN